MALFSYESSVYTTINKISDCVILSVIWTVCSLPIVTMGAATTALYHTIAKVVRREQGTMWKEYWKSFRENFKQSTIIWLIYLAAMALLGGGLVHSYNLAPTSGVFGGITVVCLILLNVTIVLAAFTLFYTSRFVFPTKTIIKNCYLISLINVGWFVMMWIIMVLVPYVLYITINPHIVFIVFAIPSLPAGIVLLLTFISERVFAKYISKEDMDQYVQ